MTGYFIRQRLKKEGFVIDNIDIVVKINKLTGTMNVNGVDYSGSKDPKLMDMINDLEKLSSWTGFQRIDMVIFEIPKGAFMAKFKIAGIRNGEKIRETIEA